MTLPMTSPPTRRPPDSPPSFSLSSVERKACLATPVGMAWLLTKGRYQLARHLLLLNLWLMALESRRIERLLILMPPRHGKTETTSRWFPFWYLARHRDHMVRLVSYGAEYASELGGKAKDLVTEYGPSLGLTLRRTANDNWSLAGTGGGMSTAGIGGPLTGRGANLLLIDDPIKNDKEARSQGIRDDHWEWLSSTAITRLEPGGVVGIILTHWHFDDIAGRIQAGKMGGEKWHVLRLPALAEADEPAWPHGLGRRAGEALWPARYPRRRLLMRQASMSAYWWAALFQQKPQQDEGVILKRAWFQYFAVVPGEKYRLFLHDGTFRDVVQAAGFKFATVDVATSTKTQADYFVIAIWHALPNPNEDRTLYPYDLVLLDVWRDHWDGPEQQAKLKAAWRQFQLQSVGIESVGYQLSLIQHAMRDGVPAEEVKVNKDKVARAMDASPMVKAGHVFFQRGAPYLAEWESELLQFPNARHDDQVDTLSAAVAKVLAFAGAGADSQDSGEREGDDQMDVPEVF